MNPLYMSAVLLVFGDIMALVYEPLGTGGEGNDNIKVKDVKDVFTKIWLHFPL